MLGHKVIPVVVLESIDEVETKIGALRSGGIKIAEITFRTECAAQAIRSAVNIFPDMCVGAGTVVNAAQCKEALDAGAKFIVGPGLSEGVARVCAGSNVPYLPGCVTPTEIIRAMELGLNTVKFFPAGVYGGLSAIKSLAAAFPSVRFVPTGGIDNSNLLEYLQCPYISAVGGSWMMTGNIKSKSKSAIAIVESIV